MLNSVLSRVFLAYDLPHHVRPCMQLLKEREKQKISNGLVSLSKHKENRTSSSSPIAATLQPTMTSFSVA